MVRPTSDVIGRSKLFPTVGNDTRFYKLAHFLGLLSILHFKNLQTTF